MLSCKHFGSGTRQQVGGITVDIKVGIDPGSSPTHTMPGQADLQVEAKGARVMGGQRPAAHHSQKQGRAGPPSRVPVCTKL